MSGEDPKIRETSDRFERRLREHGVPSDAARKEAIKQAQRADRRKR